MGPLEVPETGISSPEAKIVVPGPILLILVSKYMFFESGNPFLLLPKLYSGQECNNINSRLMGVFVTCDGKNSTISLNP